MDLTNYLKAQWGGMKSMLAVGALLAVFGFLAGGTRAVGPSDVFLFLSLGLHFSFVGVFAFPAAAKVDAIFQYGLEVVFSAHIYKYV